MSLDTEFCIENPTVEHFESVQKLITSTPFAAQLHTNDVLDNPIDVDSFVEHNSDSNESLVQSEDSENDDNNVSAAVNVDAGTVQFNI